MQYDQLGPDKLIGAVIVLNGPSLDPRLVDVVRPALDHQSQYPIICADGAANLLYDLELRKQPSFVPTAIVGDLDSVRPQVVDYYESKGTSIVQDISENSDDFHKALCVVPEYRDSSSSHLPTVIIGGYGGRFDQTFGNLNALYIEAQGQHVVYWIDPSNILLVLPQGDHTISVNAACEGPSCGIVPIGGPVSDVTTQGLQWNLTNQTLSFGKDGLISTSNHVAEPTIHIRTPRPLLWTMQFRLPV